MIEYGDWKWTCDGCGHSETQPSHNGISGWIKIQVIPSFSLGKLGRYDLCPDCAKKAKEIAYKKHPFAPMGGPGGVYDD